MFSQSQIRVDIGVYGKNFHNTANGLTCKLETDDGTMVHHSDYVFFKDSENIQCSFDLLNQIHSNDYNLFVSNNGV